MLTLEAVSYRYADSPQPVLENFSLNLSAGRIHALLGPNGAGKSTVLGLATGALTPDTGSLTVASRPAWLPQTERLSFSFTCLEYVLFGRAPHLPYLAMPKVHDESLALAALQQTGMADKKQRRITSLSGGELQLVRLARCIAQDANILLLDEPTDMLDPAHVVQVAGIIKKLAAAGRTILFSTHDIGFALACTEQALLLKDGKLVAEGEAEGILTPQLLEKTFGVRFENRAVPVPVF